MDQDPQYKTPDGSAVRIWKDAAKNNFASESHGRPIFDEVTYAEVISPGSGGSTPVFELKRVFAPEVGLPDMFGTKYAEYKQYVDAFESTEAAAANMVGTPLSEWPEISRTMASSLRASNIFSVEGLAELSDNRLSLVGPDGRTWKEKAKAWLEVTKDATVATKYAAENEALRTELEANKAQIAELAGKIAQLEAEKGAAAPVVETKSTKKSELPSIV